MTATELQSSIDRTLLAAQRGDHAAFAQFVGLTQGMLTGLALAITADRASSEDIAQDTYIEAWKRLPSMQMDSSVLPWLREVARNKSIDVLRRRAHAAAPAALDRMSEVPCAADQPPESLAAEQQAQIALRALESLSQDAREAVLLYYREGERTQRVAALLGVSDAVVRKRLQRARDKLRIDVERQVGGFARASAPGAGFGAAVAAGLNTLGVPGAVGAAGVKSLLKAWGSTLVGGLGAILAAVGVVVVAVAIDTRMYLARTRDPGQRRRLIVHGVVYAVLMGGYMLALTWAASQESRSVWVMPMAIATAALVFVLTAWRSRIVR